MLGGQKNKQEVRKTCSGVKKTMCPIILYRLAKWQPNASKSYTTRYRHLV